MTSVEQWIAMGFGIAMAFLGLILFFFRPEEGKNRIKLFGIELEISKSALIIFLVGCGVFAMPFLLPVLLPEKKVVQEGKTSTAIKQDIDVMAPHIQLQWKQVEVAMSRDVFINKGKEALNRSLFTGTGEKTNLVYGYDREYTGLVLYIQPNLVVFIVSGPNWETADKKVENLVRGF